MPKKVVFERSRRELSLHVSVSVHILLVVEQSSLESQSRGYAKTPILTVYQVYSSILSICRYLFISPRGSPSITLTRRVAVARNFPLQYFTVLRLTSDITPSALLVWASISLISKPRKRLHMSTKTTVVVLSLPCGAGATVTFFLRTMYLVRKKELTSYSCVCMSCPLTVIAETL